MWSKLKDFIRKKEPRNKQTFKRVIRAAFISISEKDLAAWGLNIVVIPSDH
jgi:hypothetical protein